MQLKISLFLFCCGILFASCRQFVKDPHVADASVANARKKFDPLPRLPSNFTHVPLFRQSTPYTCGVASLQACLYYWQVYDGREDSLAVMCGTTEDQGTPPDNIVSVAKNEFGLEARLLETTTTVQDLWEGLSQGYTIILDVQAWRDETDDPANWNDVWEDGHYVVLVGLDQHYVYIMDPSTGATYAYVPLSEFESRWHDYEVTEDGGRREYHHAAIFIRGKTPLPYPPPILYMA